MGRGDLAGRRESPKVHPSATRFAAEGLATCPAADVAVPFTPGIRSRIDEPDAALQRAGAPSRS